MRTALSRRVACLAVGLTLPLGGCRTSPASHDETSPGPIDAAGPAADSVTTTSAVAALGTTVTNPSRLRPRTAAKLGEVIEIPGHAFSTGSTPGDDGRDPTVEPALVEASLATFSIDALPYPNDPAVPARTGVTRTEAQRLCSERGERLCTELEWERACKGPDGDPYVSGNAWDAACEKEPATCASGFGVRSMGTIREWTSSHILPTSELALALQAVRGAGESEVDGGHTTPTMHRCAHRTRAKESRAQGDLGFRCCKGAANVAQIAAIGSRPGFRPTELDARQVSKIFATVPELSRLGTDIRLFDPDDIKNILARSGSKGDGASFSTAPILWSPENGAELLVMTGRGKSAAFIVALYPLPNNKYKLASYYLLLNELSPVTLAYDPRRRQELIWSACWGCAGDQGSVRVRDDHHVVVVQH